jgi:hypothetical protein
MDAPSNLVLIGGHLLTMAAEAEDSYWRESARKKRANSLYRSLSVREHLSRVREGLAFSAYTASGAGPMWLCRHGPASKTLDLTTQQLVESEEELKDAMMGMARTRVALAKAEAAYAEVLLKVVIARGF